ncbi:MAG: class I SAM-dependent methyltransferase [Chloroflexi bacterium]|nr:class I SAM-dependent methyltransferase [Chloroflexota bacterium]
MSAPPAGDENAAYFAANRARWDEAVPIHAASEGYDLAGFLRGEKTLYPVEIEEVGDVGGKSLLHLQCHFGMDTLNWARLGARVTGLDFSGAAVARARELAAEIGVEDATFVQANVYDALAVIHTRFDVVYTGIGALCWIPDVQRWANVVSSLLKPGGFLYVYEGHPMLWALDSERADKLMVVGHPYFETERPSEWAGETTYVDGPPLENQKSFEWNHGLGEIVTALIDAGLRLDFLHEHREVAWQALPWMVRTDGATAARGYARRTAWQLPPGERDLCPLMYSLKASKPA